MTTFPAINCKRPSRFLKAVDGHNKFLGSHLFVFMAILLIPFSLLTAQRIQMLELSALEYIEHPLEGEDHDLAFLDMLMLPGENLQYLNVQITDPIGGDVMWAVKNLPIPPLDGEEPISYLVDLSNAGGNAGEKILTWEVTTQWKESELAFTTPITTPLIPIPTLYRVPSGSSDPAVVNTIFFPPVFIPPPIPPDVTFHYRGCEVPNIDLDSTAHNPTTSPSVPGDKLACGPASAANSLHWLVDQHEALDTLDDSSLRAKLDSLKKYMAKDVTIGVRFDSMVTGKLRLIDELGLPIRVKYQTEHASGAGDFLRSADPRYGHVARNETGPSGMPDWDWVKQEMDHGEDVELQYGVYAEDADGNPFRAYGHWVVLTGYFDADTVKGFWYKEDTDQIIPGGTRQRWVKWCIDPDGYPYLKDMLDPDFAIGYVESFVSESYDPTVLFIDWTQFDFDFWPIEHLPGDIYDYPFHAFLAFNRPSTYGTGNDTVLLNARITNPVTGLTTWAVRNVPLFPQNENKVVYRMDLKQISAGDTLPSNIVMDVFAGPYQTDSTFASMGTITMHGDPFEHKIGRVPATSHNPIPNFALVDVTLEEPDTIKYLNRGCEVPNIDLDSLKHPDPDMGDINSCAPAAAANSLKWLMDVHEEIMDVDSLRGILDTLEMLMGKTYDGTQWDTMVMGKLEFIDKHKLPIRVKYQVHTPNEDFKPVIPSPNPIYSHSAENQTPVGKFPQFEWICNELDEGEDVEMNFTYWCDSAGVLVEQWGHSVNLIGYAIIGNERWFYFKHDMDPVKEGGAFEEKARWRVDENDYPYLEEFSFTPGCRAYVGSVISESYDPDVEFCPEKVCLPDDNGDGSLRRALVCAEEGDTILFGSVMNGQTIGLTSGPLVIDKDVVILASPSANITVSAQSVMRAFRVQSGSTVQLIGFNVEGGTASDGSGILNEGQLLLRDMTLQAGIGTELPRVVLNQGGTIQVEGFTNIGQD